MSVHDGETTELELDEHAHEACYIWQPSKHANEDADGRAVKRRKLDKKSDDDSTAWPKLLNGLESSECTRLRQNEYQKQWEQQESFFESLDDGFELDEIDALTGFIISTQALRDDGRIYAGLLPAHGADLQHQAKLFKKVADLNDTDLRMTYVALDSTSSPNLQTALKNLIRNVIVEEKDLETYNAFLSKHKRLIPMNFDLELIQLFHREYRRRDGIVIYMPEIESFDIGVLAELLTILSSWTDRIPLKLFLGIATTVELLEMRLPKAIIRCLDCQTFELSTKEDQVHELVSQMQRSADCQLFFGLTTLSALLEITTDHSTSKASLIHALKYIHMSHFFANPLSVLLCDFKPSPEDLRNLCEAIRNTNSFQEHCEKLLLEGKESRQQVRLLLNDDQALFDAARSAVVEGHTYIGRLLETLDQFKSLYTTLVPIESQDQSTLDVRLIQFLPDFLSSGIYTTLITAIQKLRSDNLLPFLTTPVASQVLNPTHLFTLQAFQKTHSNPTVHASQSSSVSTSISASGSITLTKSPHSTPKRTGQSAMQQEYTTLIESITNDIESYFREHLHLPQTSTSNTSDHTHPFHSLFLHEAFIPTTTLLPLLTSFHPRSRHAIERALTRPADYLDCECCSSHDPDGQDNLVGGLKHETAVLYTLLQEAGTIVNVRDLWDAFRGSVLHRRAHIHHNDDEGMDDDEGENGHEDEGEETVHKERQALMLFYRSLGELKMLGFCKASKKRPGLGNVDCIAKTSWKGL